MALAKSIGKEAGSWIWDHRHLFELDISTDGQATFHATDVCYGISCIRGLIFVVLGLICCICVDLCRYTRQSPQSRLHLHSMPVGPSASMRLETTLDVAHLGTQLICCERYLTQTWTLEWPALAGCTILMYCSSALKLASEPRSTLCWCVLVCVLVCMCAGWSQWFHCFVAGR